MSITTVTPENTDQYGRFTVVTREIDPTTGLVTSVHRSPLGPGSWDAGTWVPTDTAAQNAVIQAFAAQLWTGDVVDAFRAAYPAAPQV